MKWRTKAFLIPLATASIAAAARSPNPLPEVPTLVRETILQQRLAESRERNYVFREDTNDIRLRKECTWAPKCPSSGGVPFQVVRYTERHFEIFWLDGVRVTRLLPPCRDCNRGMGPGNAFVMNIPISGSELAAENRRVDREVAEAKAVHAEGKDPRSPDDPPQILLSRMLELCTFSNPRRQRINGRSTILLDFVWNPTTQPVGANEALVKFLSGTIGIDEEDHAVQHIQGRFLADVKLDGGNIRVRKGTRITIANRQVDSGIWLLSRLDAWGEGRYFAFSIDGAGHIFTGNYRAFHVTSKVLPGFVEVPTHPPAVSSPKSSPASLTAH